MRIEVAASDQLVTLLFLLLVYTRPTGLARAVHGRRRQLAVDIPDFISIDCGAPGDSLDNLTGILYKSDNNLIESGAPHQISPESHGNQLPVQHRTLRSFPTGLRNCYTLRPEAGRNNTYLIRAFFLYGNYDGKNSAPRFHIYLGADLWETVLVDHQRIQVNLFASRDYIDVCLVNIGNGDPYISVLELRRLDNAIYPIDNKKLLPIWFRVNVGGDGVRFPLDVYDRMWDPFPPDGQHFKNMRTNEKITASNGDPYRLPESMLQTASAPLNSSVPIGLIWPPLTADPHYFCFYFAEIERLAPGKFREISIVVNDVHMVAQSIKLEYLKPLTICSTWLPVHLEQLNNFRVYAPFHSNIPPILNGFEIFSSRNLTYSLTFLEDVNAIMNIKQKYKLRKNWQGDPCLPRSYMWEGLECRDSNPPRIISLDLSRSQLTGNIEFHLSGLTELESLDLSYNDLTGSLPEFLAQLPRLKILNLDGNNLEGIVPEALLLKARNGTLNLSVNKNPKLCPSPPCKKQRAFHIPVLIYVLMVVVLILVGLLIISILKWKHYAIKSKVKRSLKSREYTYCEVVNITDNFKTVIGEGGFGKVYLGSLKDKTLVAVKLLSPTSKQGYKEFQAEAKLLMIVHHRHLVSLVGYCDEGENKALIYEYMANGTVLQHISNRSTHVLNWKERLQIAVDAAQGLEYLHNGCKPPIIHRDMKTSNILLNEKLQAKIADFGLSRILASESASHLSTTPAGTFGYIDPEIHSSGNFTKKSDVYSFGIVLLELITGKPAIIMGEDYNVHILGCIKPLIEQGNIENIIDSRLLNGGLVEIGSARKVVEVAIWCTSSTSDQRPDMSCVLMKLTECLENVQSYEMCSYASFSSDSILSPR